MWNRGVPDPTLHTILRGHAVARSAVRPARPKDARQLQDGRAILFNHHISHRVESAANPRCVTSHGDTGRAMPGFFSPTSSTCTV